MLVPAAPGGSDSIPPPSQSIPLFCDLKSGDRNTMATENLQPLTAESPQPGWVPSQRSSPGELQHPAVPGRRSDAITRTAILSLGICHLSAPTNTSPPGSPPPSAPWSCSQDRTILWVLFHDLVSKPPRTHQLLPQQLRGFSSPAPSETLTFAVHFMFSLPKNKH